ncbi:helix-turn-helix domain-containing protein [Palleronia sp.]|uniref:helix-turn-helix domain-containing protein n=1 Tax=Palleronia sp. TaxID=1940284 RepID=UPI0035C7BC53
MSDAIERDWYSDQTATFGDRLADARQAVGVTQKELARRLGVRLQTLEAWENDLSEPRANRLQMISGLLNVSLMWLLTGEGEGLTAPADDAPAEVTQILSEMRQLQSDLVRTSDKLGRLEKRLRALKQ